MIHPSEVDRQHDEYHSSIRNYLLGSSSEWSTWIITEHNLLLRWFHWKLSQEYLRALIGSYRDDVMDYPYTVFPIPGARILNIVVPILRESYYTNLLGIIEDKLIGTCCMNRDNSINLSRQHSIKLWWVMNFESSSFEMNCHNLTWLDQDNSIDFNSSIELSWFM